MVSPPPTASNDPTAPSAADLAKARAELASRLAAAPALLPAAEAFVREVVDGVPVRLAPIAVAPQPQFMSLPPAVGIVLAVIPTPTSVLLAVDETQPSETICDAVLHGLAHILLDHVRVGDDYGHWDTLETIRAAEPFRRWDRAVRAAFAPWFPSTGRPPDPAAAPSALERLKFAVIRDGPRLPYGRYVGIETAPVKPWPHQEVVARRLVDTWPYSYLLCDEVGLGKTIEGGLAIRSLVLSGIAKRVLVAAPAGLTEQWQRELATKFFLPFGLALTGAGARHWWTYPSEREEVSTSLYAPDLLIVSTGLLSRTDRLDDLKAAGKFDVVLLDEAHYARRQNPTEGVRKQPRYGNLYEVVRDHLRRKAESLWLATATPMQIDAIEVSDLIALTRRVGAFQFDPSLFQAYYTVLSQLVNDQQPTEDEWEFLRRAVDAVKAQDPLLWGYVETAVIDPKIKTAARQWLEQRKVPKGLDRKNIVKLIFAAAPLSRVMLRHTRSLLEIYKEKGELKENLARRELLPLPRIVFTDQERIAYQQLKAYCEGLAEQAAKAGGKNTQAVGFLLSFLRLRFASSLYAIKETLRRRRKRVEATLANQANETPELVLELEAFVAGDEDADDDAAVGAVLKNRKPEDLRWERERLGEMLANLEDLSGDSSKMTEFLGVLERRRNKATGRIDQTVVFTRFLDTLTDIVARLRIRKPGLLVGTYAGEGGRYTDPETGEMRPAASRDEVKRRFLRGEIDVLVCTDAAAEGLNLQTADLLINFDLPWNPMKVEQRIGRIDRIGQRHEVVRVLNLCYADSAEAAVYDRLLRRLGDTEQVVGAQQLSLLPVTPEDFENLAAGTLTPDALEKQVREKLREFRRRTATMELRADDLYQTYSRLTRDANRRKAPVGLDAIWDALANSPFLRARGWGEVEHDGGRALVVRGVPGVADGTMLTTSRALYESGMPGAVGPLHFATYGDRVFEAVLGFLGAFELPAGVRRLSAHNSERPGEAVGYAVACEGGGCRLVCGWQEALADGLTPAVPLRVADLAPLHDRLNDTFRAEGLVSPLRRVERGNEQAAHAQVALTALVMARSIEANAPAVAPPDLFWPVFDDWRERAADKQTLTVPKLPADDLGRLRPLVLFDVPESRLGADVPFGATRLFLDAATDAVYRFVDSLKQAKGTLETDRVVKRLRAEADRALAAAGGAS